jgi:hypothetical protein
MIVHAHFRSQCREAFTFSGGHDRILPAILEQRFFAACKKFDQVHSYDKEKQDAKTDDEVRHVLILPNAKLFVRGEIGNADGWQQIHSQALFAELRAAARH